MLRNRTGCFRRAACDSLRIGPLAGRSDGFTQDRLDVLFHSSLVRANLSSDFGLLLTGLQQQKDVSFGIRQGPGLRVFEIGGERRPLGTKVLDC